MEARRIYSGSSEILLVWATNDLSEVYEFAVKVSDSILCFKMGLKQATVTFKLFLSLK